MAPRRTIWIDTLVDITMANSTQVVQSLVGTANVIEHTQWTLIRTLICMDIFVEPTGTVDGIQGYDIGIGVASQEAFNAGVVPDPNVAADAPARGWVYRCRRSVQNVEGAIEPIFIHLQEDIRTMRKMDSGELYVVHNNTNLRGSAFDIGVIGIIRCLYKLG